MRTKLKHIAVSGNIGSGKSSLTEKLAKHYGWHPLYESVDKNPYLQDFYADMNQWAFHLQIYFLNTRFRQLTEIRNSNATIVQDRTIYEDAHIFAANLYSSGHLSQRDYNSYLDLFNSVIGLTGPPDLLIYLKADIPKLLSNIQKRGRPYENDMPLDYLNNLNAHYDHWIHNYRESPLLVIDVNNLDFVERSEDLFSVIEMIELELQKIST